MTTQPLEFLPEPSLLFGHNQKMEYAKDGLMLFGPPKDKKQPDSLRIGVIGREDGIRRFKTWARSIQGYIPSYRPGVACHSAFPGFEAAFGAKWPSAPRAEIIISGYELNSAIRSSNRHEAVYKAVSIYTDRISEYLRTEEAHPDFWFVVVPEYVHKWGRPLSVVPHSERIPSRVTVKAKDASRFLESGCLFPQMAEEAQMYRHEVHFHNQLKARLLKEKVVVQVVRETSLTPQEFLKSNGQPVRQVQDPATVAWNICTTAYFKAGGKPWALADLRPGVCYIGLVFKKDETNPLGGNACCGAQMFLGSGEGLVFKGAVGDWFCDRTKEFHLDKKTATNLMRLIVDEYKKLNNKLPDELFIHGQTSFNEEEWEGFTSAVPEQTNLVGIRIKKERGLKLFTPKMQPVLRGSYLVLTPRTGYLWTKGFVPRLDTYPGWEVPTPLKIEINKATGHADIRQVMTDILSLTKVNFNACVYGDGVPVTLKFAHHIGEILTAAPVEDVPPLPFRHYI